MNITMITIVLGVLFGVADTIPMLKNKISMYYIISAFIFHLITPTIVHNIFESITWWESASFYFISTLPLAIIILKDNKKDFIIMVGTSTIVGVIVGILLNIL